MPDERMPTPRLPAWVTNFAILVLGVFALVSMLVAAWVAMFASTSLDIDHVTPTRNVFWLAPALPLSVLISGYGLSYAVPRFRRQGDQFTMAVLVLTIVSAMLAILIAMRVA